MLLGLDALEHNEPVDARRLLEAAHDLNSRDVLVANNLAWLLAHVEPLDLPRALALSDMAVRRRPMDPAFRGTHGHILLKLGRYQEALPHLLAALAGAERHRPAHHRALAKVYSHLQLAEVAAEHDRRAELLDKVGGRTMP
jgi:predicted Zn-dependent protease